MEATNDEGEYFVTSSGMKMTTLIRDILVNMRARNKNCEYKLLKGLQYATKYLQRDNFLMASLLYIIYVTPFFVAVANIQFKNGYPTPPVNQPISAEFTASLPPHKK